MSGFKLFLSLQFFIFHGILSYCNEYNPNDTLRIELINSKALNLKYSNTQKALELAEKSLDLSLKYDFKEGIIESKVLIAEIYMISASYDKALKHYLSALQLAEESGDIDKIAKINNEVGKINVITRNYKKALFYYNNALELNKSIFNIKEIANTYSNIGQVYVLEDSIDKGLSHYLVSYMITDSLRDTVKMVDLLNNIGNGYLKIFRYKEAIATFSEELQLSNNLGNIFTVSRAYYNLGHSYYQIKDYSTAYDNISKSLSLAEKDNYYNIIQDCEFILSRIYEATGDNKAALSHFKVYKNYSDSILNEGKLRELAALQAKYELDKKEKENEILRLQNTEILSRIKRRNNAIIFSGIVILFFLLNLILLLHSYKKQKKLNKQLLDQSRQLQDLNQQKDKFFSFVVHNLSNPFNTVWGFSELLLSSAGKKDTGKMVRYSKYIYDSAHGIRQILSNLTEWAGLQHGNYEYNPVRIELESLINDTIELNNRKIAEKEMSVSFENITNKCAFADRQMVYTVLQNLISNAIKFTPERGKIKISVKNTGSFAEISVSDTGSGISENDLKSLFDTTFVTPENDKKSRTGSGMGLIICKELVTKNGGELKAESKLNKGTTFTFTLPLPDDRIEYSDFKDEKVDQFIDKIKESLSAEYCLPEELLAKMNSLLTLHETLSRAISVEELKHFSQSIIKYSEKFNIEPLVMYGKKLNYFAENLQFDKILKILPEFPELLRIGCKEVNGKV